MVVRIFLKLTFVYSGIGLFKIYIYILYHKTCPNDQASFQVWQVELDEATMVNDIWTLKNSGPHGSWNRVAKKRPETKYLHRIKETFRFPKGLDVGHVECYTSFFVCRHVDVIHEYILIWIYICINRPKKIDLDLTTRASLRSLARFFQWAFNLKLQGHLPMMT